MGVQLGTPQGSAVSRENLGTNKTPLTALARVVPLLPDSMWPPVLGGCMGVGPGTSAASASALGWGGMGWRGDGIQSIAGLSGHAVAPLQENARVVRRSISSAQR